MVLENKNINQLSKNRTLKCYKILPEWDAEKLPRPFRECHNTKEGVWAKLKILSGSLVMEFLNDHKKVIQICSYSVTKQPNFIKPCQYHRIVSTSSDMRCQLSFYTFS